MYIKLDKDGYVIGYAIIGGISGGIEYHGETPPDFKQNYASYQLVNGQLIFIAEKKQELDEHAAMGEEEIELVEWFADYDLQVKKWTRAQRIMRPREDININDLDAEAEEKRVRLNEIRTTLRGE